MRTWISRPETTIARSSRSSRGAPARRKGPSPPRPLRSRRPPRVRPRAAHVGYYLVAEGRPNLERAIAYHPRGAQRFNRLLRARPTLTYLSLFTVLTLALVLVEVWYLERHAASWWSIVIAVGDRRRPRVSERESRSSSGPSRGPSRRRRSRSSTSPARTSPIPRARSSSSRRSSGAPRMSTRCSDRSSSTTSPNPAANLEFALLTDDVDRARRRH